MPLKTGIPVLQGGEDVNVPLSLSPLAAGEDPHGALNPSAAIPHLHRLQRPLSTCPYLEPATHAHRLSEKLTREHQRLTPPVTMAFALD